MSVLDEKHFHNEEAAYRYVEAILWPEGPVCPHCGAMERVGKLKGKSTRTGVYKCYECRKPFTVKVGTVFESSHVPLRHWLQAIFLMAASKKGVSANQLHRTLGCTLKTAWFLAHRIREAMRSGDLSPFGSNGGAVEIDETFIGHDKSKPIKTGYEHKFKVLSLVDRETGQARSMVVDSLRIADLMPILEANIAKEAHVMTDEAGQYRFLGKTFAAHGAVRHKDGEYGRGPIHTNTVEGFYSIFKRGMKGVYQHCSKEHLHRYVAEYDFRYNNRIALGIDDTARAQNLLRGAKGKRLTYQTANSQ